MISSGIFGLPRAQPLESVEGRLPQVEGFGPRDMFGRLRFPAHADPKLAIDSVLERFTKMELSRIRNSLS